MFLKKLIRTSPINFSMKLRTSLHPANYVKAIKIGDASKQISNPKDPCLVPVHYSQKNLSNSRIQHLQWILKKDILGQDMFLLGLPGPVRSGLVLQYLEMMQREVEYVVLSRDTTENDLKQRREVKDGSVHYVDQSAVLAAIEGRFLVLDGVEKVERNVLPVLNNLLENREVQLEDGRFLVTPERYDKFLKEHGQEELDRWKLVRVSENFRVVALGLPVPYFKGNPLDPPFRSRFQARQVQLNYEDQMSELLGEIDNSLKDYAKNFLSSAYAFLTKETIDLGMPMFPIENASIGMDILSKFSCLPLEQVFRWIYPYPVILSKENSNYLLQILEKFSVAPKKIKAIYKVSRNKTNDVIRPHLLEINFNNNTFLTPVLGHKGICNEVNFVSNSYHESILSNLLMTHSVHDFCLIGKRGNGKATLIRKFASLLNYPVEMVMLYTDMTARDLLQQRTTDERGNTAWRPSQVVQAAEAGNLLVLDGLHRLHSSTLSVLQRLIQHREMQLYDGTRLLRHDRYDILKQKFDLSDDDMVKKKLIRIHPAFRIVALAEPPKLNSPKGNWVTPEVLSMFLFHEIRPLSFKEEKLVIQSLVPIVSEKMNTVLNFAQTLRNSNDDALKNVSSSFSTRQLVRIARRLCSFPDESVYSVVSQTCLMQFLPPLTRQTVENVLEQYGIQHDISHASSKNEIYVKDNILTIGDTSAEIGIPGLERVKVPNVLFYNSQGHVSVMEAMLRDFLLGEHLLLIGNQGVGKNKVTDRFLQLLNRPREYIQLHRDTTVQSLTQQPSVVNGQIVYEDSPLLKAVQHGRVLVVDEADKAPTHVTSILKALVVSGEMKLSDGRSVVHHNSVGANQLNVVTMHPDFKMIVLANRPGFPFLGNDFFATLGDIFSCHSVDNPSLESEISMLRQYAPNVPEYALMKLASLFNELRIMSDKGLIPYPYSTREVVNVIKHLERFPEEGIFRALKNVFDFDAHSADLKEKLNDILRKHGIATESQTLSIKICKKHKLPKSCPQNEIKIFDLPLPWIAKTQELRITNPNNIAVKEEDLDWMEGRTSVFSELQNYSRLPIHHSDIPLSIAASKNDSSIYVATANPIALYRIKPNQMVLNKVILSAHFPAVRSGFKPSLSIVPVSFENEECVVLHESTTNQTILIDLQKKHAYKINMSSLFENAISKLSSAISSKTATPYLYLCPNVINNQVILLDRSNSKVILLDFKNSKVSSVVTPEIMNRVYPLGKNILLLSGKEHTFIADVSKPDEWKIRKVEDNSVSKFSDFTLSTRETHNGQSNPESIASSALDFACIISGSFGTDKTVQLMRFIRDKELSEDSRTTCIAPKSRHIITFLKSEDLPDGTRPDRSDSGYLEVVDLNESTCSYIDVNLPHSVSSFANWLMGSTKPYLLMCLTADEKLVTVDAKGSIQQWEINQASLTNSFQVWKKSSGLDSEQQLTIEYVNEKPVSHPKHGKVDPTGAPHVGGNTWAGGTGGRDTAGLGGKGGPYRLDAGHQVFQISDQEKDNVPPEVRKAAREMGQRAFQDKLKEIQMSEYDADLYYQFYGAIESQTKALRVILDSLQTKGKERQWIKHQTSGEFDDTKLVEGITGEKSIYRRRGDQEPEVGSPLEKPKLLRIVADVSGSMYRFNGYDNRLQRQLENVVLVMEAFDGYHDRFRYEILGHSGEEFHLQFSRFDDPPKTPKEKLDLIRNMHAHSQFCMSGDHTLEATEHAIRTITDVEADEYFVVVLSDANLDRYGISPMSFGKLLVSNPKVNAFAIFIGSLGDQATMLSKRLPAGRAFMCLDSSNLTSTLQKIFTSALLKD